MKAIVFTLIALAAATAAHSVPADLQAARPPKDQKAAQASNFDFEDEDISGVFIEEVSMCSKRYGKDFVLMGWPDRKNRNKILWRIDAKNGKIYVSEGTYFKNDSIAEMRRTLSKACG
jgi:hypothetical protein